MTHPKDIAEALTLGASILPNTRSFLEAWDSQDFSEIGRQIWRVWQMESVHAPDTLPCECEY